jgi:hypothetical protein
MAGGVRPAIAGNLAAQPDVAESFLEGPLDGARKLGD